MREYLINRYGHSCVIKDDKMFIIGGKNTKTVSSVEIYDISRNVWSQGPELPYQLSESQSVVYENQLYVLGGHKQNEDESNNDVLRLKSDESGWENVAETYSMPFRSLFPAMILPEEILRCV